MKRILFLFLSLGFFWCVDIHAQSRTIISEVLYDIPDNEDSSLGTPYSNGEFIELYNPDKIESDISGWKLTNSQGEVYTLPLNTLIKPRTCIIIAFRCPIGEPYYFHLSYMGIKPLLHQRKLILHNKPSTISLFDKKGVCRDQVFYDQNSAPNQDGTWFGDCRSIQRKYVKFNDDGSTDTGAQDWVTDIAVTIAMADVTILSNLKDRTDDPASKNYITTQVTHSINGIKKSVTTQYFDGLGQLTQTVENKVTPQLKDKVTLYDMDIFGRPNRAWLPLPTQVADGAYKHPDIAKDEARSYFNDATPYAETKYQSGVEGKVVSQMNVGAEYTEDCSIRTFYNLNISPGVLYMTIDLASQSIIINDYHRARSLSMTMVKNEIGTPTFTYTDKAGRVLLTRINYEPENTDTYYVYDPMGRLTVVITPEGVEKIKTEGLQTIDLRTSFVNAYCYFYKYDGLGNVIECKFPGGYRDQLRYDEKQRLVRHYKGHTHYVPGGAQAQFTELYAYDNCNRLLNIWSICKHLTPESDPNKYYDTQITDSISQPKPGMCQPLIKYQYDDYSGVPQTLRYIKPSLSTPQEVVFSGADYRTQGFKTYEKIAVLDGLLQLKSTPSQFIERAFYYNQRGALIQMVEKNHLKGVSRYCYGYDFSGNLIYKLEKIQHTGTSSSNELLTRYEYDHAGRMTKEITRLNERDPVTTTFTYNENGQVEVKSVNEISESYQYNLQGWLTKQENSYYNASLNYSKDGGINAWEWKHQDDNTYKHFFHYDPLGRITKTDQYVNGSKDNKYVERDITYDKNGNIKTLKRLVNYTPENLQYTYANGALQAVNGSQYTYNAMGSMIHDGRNNLDISYNFVNLPYQVSRNGQTLVTYRYLADGTKLETIMASGEGLVHIGSITYTTRNGTITGIDGIPFNGGRLIFTQTSSGVKLVPQHHIIDHLGSIRAVVQSGQVVENINYFAFGKKWTPTGAISSNRYLFNGKEEQQWIENSDWLDYGARVYDPNIGRWQSIDPLAEKNPGVSPHVYCRNNPVSWIDPTGLGEFWYKGQLIGNDDINDGKVYVLMTTKSKFTEGNETVPAANMSWKDIRDALKFIEGNSGNKDAFEKNSIAYDSSIEIVGKETVREAMVKEVSHDNGLGDIDPANNREYGGRIEDDGITAARPGHVTDPRSDAYAQMTLPSGGPTFHSHPSGNFYKKGEKSGSELKYYIQHTSNLDLNAAGSHTHYTFGMGSRKVYVYTSEGVQAVIPMKYFVNPKVEK